MSYYDSRRVADVARIPRHAVICDREVLPYIVEVPLLAACEMLYDKNVRTVQSSANLVDAHRGYAWLVLDLSSLSPANRAYAEPLADEISQLEVDGQLHLPTRFVFPIDNVTTIDELEAKSLKFARGFQLQNMDWSPRETLEEARERVQSLEHDDHILIDWMIQQDKYWVPEDQMFYHSREHYEKILAFRETADQPACP